MSEENVQCPSGFSGLVRGLKGREFKILSNKKEAKSGVAFDRILGACWTETTEQGPYAFPEKVKWDDVLICDRFLTLIRIRLATYPGEDYPITSYCERPDCGEKIEWDVPLEKLPVKMLPDESLKIFAEDNRFKVKFGGKNVFFKLSTGKDEKKAQRFLQKQDPDLLAAIRTRIVEVEGMDRLDITEFLEDCGFADLRQLLEKFEEVDGGVETDITIQCTHCDAEQVIALPFDEEFFMPRKKKKT